jgi:Fe-Mn family superoxide dismutase
MAISRREFLVSLASTTGLAIFGGIGSIQGASSKPIKLDYSKHSELYPVHDGTQYLVKDFSHLLNNKNLGLSPAMIENHLGLYRGYVEKVNNAEKQILAGDLNETAMKHLAFSLNGMALHDIYFSNMSTDSSKRSKALNQAIDESFGSFEKYFSNLNAIAGKMPGWSITALNLLNGKLINYGVSDHSANFPNFVIPILALDVYEHAYTMDFGTDGKPRYLDVFGKIIDWDMVSRRYSATKKLLA